MTNRDFVLQIMRENGRADALSLRSRAATMDGTAIIAEEHKIPAWDGDRDYSGYPIGAPVCYGDQVYTLLQAHNAAYYPGSSPANTPALWSIRHTKDPARAKPYAAPAGTSGLYMVGECCVSGEKVYRCNTDNCAYSPTEYAAYWDLVEVV